MDRFSVLRELQASNVWSNVEEGGVTHVTVCGPQCCLALTVGSRLQQHQEARGVCVAPWCSAAQPQSPSLSPGESHFLLFLSTQLQGHLSQAQPG